MNAVHSVDGFLVREMTRRCYYNKAELIKMKGLLEADINISKAPKGGVQPIYEKLFWVHGFMSLACVPSMLINGISAYSLPFKEGLLTLIDDVLEYSPFELLQIHDEFKCHPNHVNRMRAVYIGILAEIADSDMGQEIIRQIRNDDTFVLEKLSDDLGDDIREGNYAIA